MEFDGKIPVVSGRNYVLIFDVHPDNIPEGIQVGTACGGATIAVPTASAEEERPRGHLAQAGVDLRSFLAQMSVQSFSVLRQREDYVRVFVNCTTTSDDPVNPGFNHWTGPYANFAVAQCFLMTWEKAVVSWKNGKTSITMKGRRQHMRERLPQVMITFVVEDDEGRDRYGRTWSDVLRKEDARRSEVFGEE